MSLNSLLSVNQIITTNSIEIRVRQKCERVAGFLAKVA